MITDTKTEVDQKPTATLEKIWENLVVTDQQENNFPFSNCRNRHIVVLGYHRAKSYVVGDIIQRDNYTSPSYYPRNMEQKTITYVMVQDDSSCNVCIINLIDIPPLENFIKRAEKSSEDPSPSPMAEIDKTIYKYASYIDLIIFVCDHNDLEAMKNMKKWASNRGHIMALVFIVNPKDTTEKREKIKSSILNNEKFIEYGLGDFFEKGIFCISDLSYNFRSREDLNLAQNNVKEWRSKFLRACIGDRNDTKYPIQPRDEKHSKYSAGCHIS